jgi:hypothetical protein
LHEHVPIIIAAVNPSVLIHTIFSEPILAHTEVNKFTSLDTPQIADAIDVTSATQVQIDIVIEEEHACLFAVRTVHWDRRDNLGTSIRLLSFSPYSKTRGGHD